LPEFASNGEKFWAYPNLQLVQADVLLVQFKQADIVTPSLPVAQLGVEHST
jgi:hypothetical protein